MSQNSNDSAWDFLFNDETVSSARKKGEKDLREFSTLQIKQLRKRMKHDLFFLATVGLGYDRLSKDFHGSYCQWLKQTWGERYRMTLFARDHYKTTVNTVSDSIQMALPGGKDLPHPYCLGPNGKILLSHEARESASRFLYEITAAFRAKPVMLALFPELIPHPRKQRMNKFELELPRTEHHKEPTFDTIGVGGAAQGRHYNWLKLDDLVGEDARDSETVMGRVLTWFDNINSLLTRLKIDGWDLVGTRWSASDVYAHAVKMYGVNRGLSILNAYDSQDVEKMDEGDLLIYARGALERGLPVFPEEFDLKDLNRIRRNPVVWAAQYANNPREGGLTEFKPEWLKRYQIGRGDRLITFEGDESRIVHTADLDRNILIDPSMGKDKHSDPSGLIVTGTDQHLNVYILKTIKVRLKAPELVDLMFELYTTWNPRLISVESVAFSYVLGHWFEQKCQDLGIYPNVYEYKPGSKKSKAARVRGLANYAAGGQIYILEGMHELRDEWDWFPLSDDYHLLDALAQGPEIWAPGVSHAIRETDRAITSLREDDRDVATGY